MRGHPPGGRGRRRAAVATTIALRLRNACCWPLALLVCTLAMETARALQEAEDIDNCSLPAGPLFVRGDDGYYVDPATDMVLPACAANVGGQLASSEVSVLYPCRSCRVEVGWVLRTMLGSCGPLRIICWEDLLSRETGLQQQPKSEHQTSGKLLRSFAEKIAAIGGDKGDVSTRPVAAINSRLYKDAVKLLLSGGVRLSEVVLVHLGDEQIANAFWDNYGPDDWAVEYQRWHHVFRNHWLDDPTAGWPFQRAASMGRLDYFPLGLTRQFYGRSCEPESAVPSSARKTFFSFSGGLALREAHLHSVKRAVGSALLLRHPPKKSAPHGYRSKDDDHIKLLMASSLCLMVPAASIETNRLYESLEVGCVPVFVSRQGVRGVTYDADMARLVLYPLENVSGSFPPFLRAYSPAQLPRLLNSTRAALSALNHRQAELRAWWSRAQRHFRRKFEAKICPLTP